MSSILATWTSERAKDASRFSHSRHPVMFTWELRETRGDPECRVAYVYTTGPSSGCGRSTLEIVAEYIYSFDWAPISFSDVYYNIYAWSLRVYLQAAASPLFCARETFSFSKGQETFCMLKRRTSNLLCTSKVNYIKVYYIYPYNKLELRTTLNWDFGYFIEWNLNAQFWRCEYN
jgi:hypothetical protein